MPEACNIIILLTERLIPKTIEIVRIIIKIYFFISLSPKINYTVTVLMADKEEPDSPAGQQPPAGLTRPQWLNRLSW